MAKKENEENKDVNQEPEEDFGLPDLEFEELDDIEDEEEEENLEDEIAEIVGNTTDEDEVSLDEPAKEDSLSDIGITEETESVSDFSNPDAESGDEELDEVEKFISEITADDDIDGEIDASTDSVENQIEEITGGDESPDSNTEMFDQVEDNTDSDDSSYSSYDDDEEEEDEGGTNSSFTKIIIIGLVIFVGVGFILLKFSGGDDDAVAEAETSAPVVETPVEETPVETEPVEETPEVEETPAQAQVSTSTGTPGEITTISSSEGRYYIVVASFIDDDMANDHANDLAAQGASVKIIKPFNERKYHRVSVADYGSKQDAINATEQLKSQFGDDIWALKY